MSNLGRMIGTGRGRTSRSAEATENANDLAALAPTLDAQQLERAQEIAKNRRLVIEERRKAKPVKAGPGESET